MVHYSNKNFVPGQNIGFMLVKARNIVSCEADAALKELGVTGQQMGVLLTLHRGEAMTSVALSKLFCIDTGSVSRMLDRLESKGLVRRIRSTEDRRVIVLRLTPEGERIADKGTEFIVPLLNSRLSRFSEEEFSEFFRFLQMFLSD